MSGKEIILINALALPEDSRVDQRVPKKLMLEYGVPTPADKRAIQDGIEELFWVAALKPTHVGVSAFRDEIREYLEIVVLTAVFRGDAKTNRLIELIHRAIPYPVALLAETGETWTLSVAHKRGSQGETGKVVIEDVRCTTPILPSAPTAVESGFLASLAVSGLPKGDLFTLYQGWLDRVAALEAARLTDAFVVPGAPEQGEALKIDLESYNRIERELVSLRARAKKEKHINRRVELNVEIKRLEGDLAGIRERL